MGDFRRCQTHDTALTPTGACVLCQRRGAAPATTGRTLTWMLAGIVGTAIAAAIGFRVHLALADGAIARATARPNPTAAANPGSQPGTATSAATTEMPSPASSSHLDPTELLDAQQDHERRIAQAERSVQIDFYGAGWCPSCRKARTWLDSQSISYTYRDTSDEVNSHTMRALNPKSTIPTIDIEGQVVVGFNPAAMRASIRRAAEARVLKSAGAQNR